LLVKARRELLFISPRFLFPADTGGAIRTTEILRCLRRDGAFTIRLLSPAAADRNMSYERQLSEIADEWQCWTTAPKVHTYSLRRLPLLASRFPIPVASDWSADGRRIVAAALERRPEVAVFDFLHSVVLAPSKLEVPSVLFTHNVEAEIFERNLNYAKRPWDKAVWRNQLRKMRSFEQDAMRRFDRVIAVSTRDAARFERDYGRTDVDVIPTGVNVDYFSYEDALPDGRIVFTGSMDWLANIDAISWFRDEVWPLIAARRHDATMTVVGRNPPDHLVRAAPAGWTFTGRVEDIRPHVRRAAAFVIPMRIGGGTRIKAYEAMAMGIPVVSTSVGIEGLDVQAGKHFLIADSAGDLADAIVGLLQRPDFGLRIARAARQHIESRYSSEVVACSFSEICERAIGRAASRDGDTAELAAIASATR
jgi:glycosyltransferase involved in cell wall biosynthesis